MDRKTKISNRQKGPNNRNPFDTAPVPVQRTKAVAAKNDLDAVQINAGVLRSVIKTERDNADRLRKVLVTALTAEIKTDRRRIADLEQRLEALES